jgi:sugar lactone lactonase YvrE
MPSPDQHDRAALPHAQYKMDVLGSSSPMHGVQGIAFGPDGALYAASVAGHSIFRIDIATAAITTFVGPPEASADDLAFAPDGTVVWTNISEGIVYACSKDGKIRPLARNMPGVNGIAFTRTGRLFVTCVLARDGLYEVDLGGIRPPRTVVENIGNLNAFQFADDKFIYGPIMSTGKVAKINIDSGAMSDVATGFKLPTSVRIEGDGRLIVVDYLKGEVVRIEPENGRKTLIASLSSMIDNSAIAKDGTIYVSSPAHNGITAIDPKTFAQRRVAWSDIGAPGLLTMVDVDGKERLLLADITGPRFMDPETGKTEPINSEVILSGVLAIAMSRDAYVLSVRGNILRSPNIQVLERTTGKSLAVLPDFGAPYDVKPLSDGFVVADFATGQLTKISNDPAHTRTTLAANLDGPVGLADAGYGVFYVSEYKGGRISRVNTKSGAKDVVIDGLNAPEGIALAPDGRLIVAEVGRKRVLAVEVGTRKATIIADRLAIGLTVDPQAQSPFLPTGVAVGKNNAIYVPSDINNVMYRLTPQAS